MDSNHRWIGYLLGCRVVPRWNYQIDSTYQLHPDKRQDTSSEWCCERENKLNEDLSFFKVSELAKEDILLGTSNEEQQVLQPTRNSFLSDFISSINRKRTKLTLFGTCTLLDRTPEPAWSAAPICDCQIARVRCDNSSWLCCCVWWGSFDFPLAWRPPVKRVKKYKTNKD